MAVTKEIFGTTKDGKEINRYFIVNSKGMKVELITYNLKRKDGGLWENKLINVHFAK